MPNNFKTGLLDILKGLSHYSLIGVLGWHDLCQRYRRSVLGPLWITLSMLVLISTLGFVFGHIFKSPLKDFFPFITLGIILWNFISATITEGCLGFISVEHIIKQLPLPFFIYVLRILWRNILVLGHNLLIFPLVLLVVGKPLGFIALLSVPGFILLSLNLAWIVFLLSIFCTRYRDFPPIITSLIQIVFYITPIIWMPNLISSRFGSYLLNLNPIYHLFEIVRSPLLGTLPSLLDWMVSIGMAVVGWLITLALYGRYKNRIAYWL